jgi:hypothetical protein
MLSYLHATTTYQICKAITSFDFNTSLVNVLILDYQRIVYRVVVHIRFECIQLPYKNLSPDI